MIVNFAPVTALLYRSGRYSAHGLRQVVEQHGIKRVIDLRDHLKPLLAISTYQRMGVVFERVPIDEYAPLPAMNIELECPTLIHCWRGAHRTGALVARYRLAQGWSREQAWAEMASFGFGNIAARAQLFSSVFGVWRP